MTFRAQRPAGVWGTGLGVERGAQRIPIRRLRKPAWIQSATLREKLGHQNRVPGPVEHMGVRSGTRGVPGSPAVGRGQLIRHLRLSPSGGDCAAGPSSLPQS